MIKNRIKQLKQELKELAVEIRKLKSERKSREFGYVPGLSTAKYDARHKHIAYCMLRGRTYEEIEQTCREQPSKRYIEELMEASNEPEDVCVSEEGSDNVATSGTSGSCLSKLRHLLFG